MRCEVPLNGHLIWVIAPVSTLQATAHSESSREYEDSTSAGDFTDPMAFTTDSSNVQTIYCLPELTSGWLACVLHSQRHSNPLLPSYLAS